MNLGKITNQLAGNLGAGGGIGSRACTENQPAQRMTPEPSMFRDEQGTEWLNIHEASSRRGQARDSGDGQGRRGANEIGGR
jgi:hypothetical protein